MLLELHPSHTGSPKTRGTTIQTHREVIIAHHHLELSICQTPPRLITTNRFLWTLVEHRETETPTTANIEPTWPRRPPRTKIATIVESSAILPANVNRRRKGERHQQ